MMFLRDTPVYLGGPEKSDHHFGKMALVVLGFKGLQLYQAEKLFFAGYFRALAACGLGRTPTEPKTP